MVETGEIHADAHGGGCHAHGRCFQEAHQLFLLHSLHEEGDDHEEDDHEVVIGHLHMVGQHLKSREEGRDEESGQIFSPVGQHDTSYERWQISQRPHFPDMSGRYDDEEIAGEGPHDGSQRCERLTEVEGSQQDIEPEQIDKDVPHIVGQPQMIGLRHLGQSVGAAVRR